MYIDNTCTYMCKFAYICTYPNTWVDTTHTYVLAKDHREDINQGHMNNRCPNTRNHVLGWRDHVIAITQ